jgi:mycothiol system anti-sigma-R factor
VNPFDEPYDRHCDDPYDRHCAEVLQRMFFFIDNELDRADCAEIEQHLHDCGPCLEKYNLERTVKLLVQRSCTEHAPETLRDRVLLRIRQVQVDIHIDPA